jgi:hypothetical protein
MIEDQAAINPCRRNVRAVLRPNELVVGKIRWRIGWAVQVPVRDLFRCEICQIALPGLVFGYILAAVFNTRPQLPITICAAVATLCLCPSSSR